MSNPKTKPARAAISEGRKAVAKAKVQAAEKNTRKREHEKPTIRIDTLLYNFRFVNGKSYLINPTGITRFLKTFENYRASHEIKVGRHGVVEFMDAAELGPTAKKMFVWFGDVGTDKFFTVDFLLINNILR